jgi:hypothetical protein
MSRKEEKEKRRATRTTGSIEMSAVRMSRGVNPTQSAGTTVSTGEIEKITAISMNTDIRTCVSLTGICRRQENVAFGIRANPLATSLRLASATA